MNHAPLPPLRGLHRWSGLLAAAVVSLSVVTGMVTLFATVDAEHASIAQAQQPAAAAGACIDAVPGAVRCDPPEATVVARVSPFDDADTR